MARVRESPRRRLLSRAQFLERRAKAAETVPSTPSAEFEDQQQQSTDRNDSPEASADPVSVHNESTNLSLQRSPSPVLPRLGETTYRYKDLDRTKHEIRLLRILPGDSSTIKCEMTSTSLDNPIPYTAISYAWGDPEDTCLIYVDEHAFPVTISLYLALQRLGRTEPTESYVVWADAACINQQNVHERNQQVRAMMAIYQTAANVAVWLGPATSDTGRAVSLLYRLRHARNSASEIRTIIRSISHRPDFEALLALFERNYWKRLWVVQEVMYGENVRIYCGQYSSSWDTYDTVSEVLQRYIPDLVRVSGGFGLFTTSSRFHSWADVLAKTGPRGLRPYYGKFSGLFDALLYHRWKACADPRDKVYGLLGIVPIYEKDAMAIDYNKSVVEVYIKVVEHVLCTTRKMDVICASIHYPVHHSIEGLPSWAPDWSNPSQREPLGYHNLKFSAAGSTKASYEFTKRRKKLEISAVVLDSIADCGTPVYEVFALDDLLMAFFQWRMKLVARFGYDDEIAHQKFCRTLCCDKANTTMATPQDWMKWIYCAFGCRLKDRFPALQLDAQLTSYANHPNALWEAVHGQNAFDQYIVSSMVGRGFFITSSGNMCLGSGAGKTDDIICVPLGCSTPVILRKDDSEYRFVGDVYVNGYMYGKAVDEHDAGTRQLETFLLH